MALITLDVQGAPRGFEVVDYSVQADITPLAPGDTSGGVGRIEAAIVTRDDGPVAERSALVLDKEITLSDVEVIEFTRYRGRGHVTGRVISNTQLGGQTKLSAETLLYKLNVSREASAFYGVRKTGELVTYVVNAADNPSLENDTAGYSAVAGTDGTAVLTRSNLDYAAYAGSYHGRVTWSADATGTGGVDYLHTGVNAGDELSVGIAAMLASGLQSMAAAIDWRNAANAVIGTAVGDVDIVDQTGYTILKVSGVAPAGTTNAVIRVHNLSSEQNDAFHNWIAGDILIFDALIISLDYHEFFDGSFADASWEGIAGSSPSRLAVRTVQDEGYDATVANAVRYYCGLVDIPVTQISIDQDFETMPVAYPGWSGSVWMHLKLLCAAVGAEIVLRDNLIVFRRPRQHTLTFENQPSLDRKIDLGGTAESVELVNYNSHWGVDEVAFEAHNIGTIATNEVRIITESIPHFLDSVNQPVGGSLSSEYVGGPGEYAILDSDGTAVNVASWESMGGSVTASLLSPSELQIIVIGPRTDPVGHTSPYRLATYVIGVSGEQPALRITGSGVFVNKETVVIPTAATATQTTATAGASVDNPFLSNREITLDRGVLTAMQTGGPNITLSGVITYANGDLAQASFSDFMGSRLFYDHAYYRVTSATISSAEVQFDAAMDTMFYDVVETYSVTFDENNALWVGATFDTYNASIPPGSTFDDVMAEIPSPSFDEINALYAGMTFNDHAVFSLLPVSS